MVTGAGEKAFIAGADIGEMAQLEAGSAREFIGCVHGCCDLVTLRNSRMNHLRKSMCAAMHGELFLHRPPRGLPVGTQVMTPIGMFTVGMNRK